VLDPSQRYLTVIAPVFSGSCAIFDTEKLLLTPVQVGNGRWHRTFGDE
jgi:hypothetical protein